MSKVETADIILRADEIAYGMQVFEADDGFCTRLIVERGDMPVSLVIHHGPDEEFSAKIPPLHVAGQATVGEMLQESERHRKDLRWYLKAQAQLESSTLIQDAIRTDEQARLLIQGKSTFGPHQTIQRNAAYSHETTLRNWWSERAQIKKQTKHYRVQGVRA